MLRKPGRKGLPSSEGNLLYSSCAFGDLPFICVNLQFSVFWTAASDKVASKQPKKISKSSFLKAPCCFGWFFFCPHLLLFPFTSPLWCSVPPCLLRSMALSSVSILNLQTIKFTFPNVSSSWNFWFLGFYHSWASWRAALAFPGEVKCYWSRWQSKETWTSKNLFWALISSSASSCALRSRRASLESPGQGKSQLQITTTALPYLLWCISLGVCAHIWLPWGLLSPSRPQVSWRG